MVKQIDERIQEMNIDKREFKPYFQEVPKTKKENISCKLQKLEKERLEKYFKSHNKSNQEGYEEIILNYLDSLCFEQKYFQFQFGFVMDKFEEFDESNLLPFCYVDNYELMKRNIENILPSSLDGLLIQTNVQPFQFLMDEGFVDSVFFNDMELLIGDDSINLDEVDDLGFFLLQLNNYLDVPTKDGIFKAFPRSSPNEHRGIGVVVYNVEKLESDFFFLDYTWEFVETKDGFMVNMKNYMIIPFEKVGTHLIGKHKESKVNEFLNKFMESINKKEYVKEDFVVEVLDGINKQIDVLLERKRFFEFVLEDKKRISKLEELEGGKEQLD